MLLARTLQEVGAMAGVYDVNDNDDDGEACNAMPP
jgi:hypothetical protein